jgi:N-acetylneuraminate synthase/N,N'-diacetyllegionaminate synthase
VIAEAGVNHNGDPALAAALVDAAADAGADAVKFQTFVAERLTTAATPKAEYQRERTGASDSMRDMLRSLELSAEAHTTLQRQCAARGVLFLSTPFDERSVDLLDGLGVPAFKVSSGEITNTLLLDYIARKKKPVLLSTGMATLNEVRCAVDTITHAGNDTLALLQCTSAYPAPIERANLRSIATLAEAFGVPVGYSDHTPGITAALAAVAVGACIVEKHLTTDRTLPGPDHAASLEPPDFKAMVRGIRDVEAALGDGVKAPAPEEEAIAAVARRSLVAARDLRAGERLDRNMVTAKRPGTGLSPATLSQLLGRRLRVDVAADALLVHEMFE